MKWTLHRPPPLTPMLGWREQGGLRRLRRGAHSRRTAPGNCRTAPDANMGQCWLARPSSAPVGRRDNITTTASTAGAPTSRINDQR